MITQRQTCPVILIATCASKMATSMPVPCAHTVPCSRLLRSVYSSVHTQHGPLHCFTSSSAKRSAITVPLCCGAPRGGRIHHTSSADTGKPCKTTSRQLSSISQHDAQAASAVLVGLALGLPEAAQAFSIHQEPANALSLPTWVIHISSVIEWVVAMALVWQYAEVTGNPKWKGLTWGMMPLLGGAICACTYHFFYNSPDLDILVAIQASLTWIGNATCAAAAFRIYQAAQQEGAS